MKYVVYVILFTLLSCSLRIKTGNKNDELVKRATVYLFDKKIITNNCITQNDTIFVILKKQNAVISYYLAINNLFSKIHEKRFMKKVKSSKNILTFCTDNFITDKKIIFEYTCVSQINGYLKYDTSNQIVALIYNERMD